MKILLVEKNSRVGGFIKRELEKDHHELILAESAGIMKVRLEQQILYDFLIIDPDLPDMENNDIFKAILENAPGIPVLLHSFSCDLTFKHNFPNFFVYVEKNGSSVSRIRDIVIAASQSMISDSLII